MSSFIKGFLQPVDNQLYTNKKISIFVYASRYTLAVLVCLVGALTVSAWFWAILLLLILLAVIDYVVFDAFLDKVMYKLLWRRVYRTEMKPRSPAQDIMKQFEQNPTPENYEALQNHLKK